MPSLLPIVLLALVSQERTPVAPDDAAPRQVQGETLVLYDVRDLVASMPPQFDPPELGVPTAPSADEPAAPARVDRRLPAGYERVVSVEPSTEEIERGGRALEQLVRAFIDPPLTDPGERVRSTEEATLVVNATPEQHAWVERFLTGLRTFEGLVEIETAIYTAPRGVLAEWGLAPSTTLSGRTGLQGFRQRVVADERFQVVNAPRLMVFPCQRASISVVNQIAFVQDWQIHIVEPGGQEIADPQIAVLQEGLVVDARATPLPGGRFGLQLELTSCEVERPIPTRKVRISAASGREVEIGLPQVKTARFASTVVLAGEDSAVLVTADTDPERDLVVLVTARRVATREPR